MCKILAHTIIIMSYLLSPSHRRMQDFPGGTPTPKGGGTKLVPEGEGAHPNLYYVNPPLLQARRIVGLTHTEWGLSLMDLLYINE